MTKPAESDCIVIPRTGDLPLKIQGQELANASSQFVNGRDRNRWHEIVIYHASKFVAHIKWCSQWEGEHKHDTCLIADDLADLARQIRDYDPLEYLIGYPDGQQFEKKQERLENMIADDWSAIMTSVFLNLGVTETL